MKNIKRGTKDELRRKYSIKAKGFKMVTEELKQTITAKTGNLKHYKARVNQYRQTKLFCCNQKALSDELGGKRRETSDPPHASNARTFWSEIWDKSVQYKEDDKWLVKVKKELEVVKIQNNVVVTKDVIKQVRKMLNWKSPGLDYIQGFWIKRFSSLYQKIVDILNNELQSASIPEWMKESCTVLFQEGPISGNAVGKYRPIAWLNLLWKLLTGIITDKLYEHTENQDLLPEQQKDCRQRSHGTKDQLIHKAVIKNCRRRNTNLNMAWIDFRKAYNMAPHS